MSLLLDALKKAADDKQKAENSGLSAGASDNTEAAVEGIAGDEGLPGSEVRGNEKLVLQDVDERNNESAGGHDLELTLDEVTPDEVTNGVNETHQAPVEQPFRDEEKHTSATVKNTEQVKYSVSDDALSLLIYKTNRDVKLSKRMTFLGILLVCAIILVSGGVYHYLDMNTEIAMLERKHQIAMKAMQSKTSQEKSAGSSELVRNLVSDSDLKDKVQYAKNKTKSTKGVMPARATGESGSGANTAATITATSKMSIEKTRISDPVGEKLDNAWLIYESGRYAEASSIYKDVLAIENDNRDALLGLGAIAVIEKNNAQARNIYRALLEQDPRDPIATAALASLHDNESSLKTDEEYLISMLGKNPETPHLNFALGNNYAQQKKWQSAQQYYFNAWQFDNDNADYIFNLAVSLDQLGKQQQAISFYKDSLVKSENKQVSFLREDVKKRIRELTGL